MKRIIFITMLVLLYASAETQTPMAARMDAKVHKEIRINCETASKLMHIRKTAEYDSLGNLIHHNDGLIESWHEYDSAGREVYSKESHAASFPSTEWWHEYDEKGRIIHSKCSGNEEKWFEYDGKGQLIRSVNTRSRPEYAGAPRPISSKTFQSDTARYEYDGKGRLIHSKEQHGPNVEENWYEYDRKGRKTYWKKEIAKWRLLIERRYSYNGKGDKIRAIGQTRRGGRSDTFDWRYEYDGKGRLIHSKSSEGKEEWFEYDDRGNQICERSSLGSIVKTDYTFWGNGKIKTKTEYVYLPKN